jgi:malonyl-CoA/methylmalonyl-CoA synthetase
MDIIKRAGYKISALDIERILLEHKNISECSVIGIDDSTFGQKIGGSGISPIRFSPI